MNKLVGTPTTADAKAGPSSRGSNPLDDAVGKLLQGDFTMNSLDDRYPSRIGSTVTEKNVASLFFFYFKLFVCFLFFLFVRSGGVGLPTIQARLATPGWAAGETAVSNSLGSSSGRLAGDVLIGAESPRRRPSLLRAHGFIRAIARGRGETSSARSLSRPSRRARDAAAAARRCRRDFRAAGAASRARPL